MKTHRRLTFTGGMMPELDSCGPSDPAALTTRFSPWHACGPDYSLYSAGMKRSAHLSLAGCVLRLQPGDTGHEAAARQWEETFGVARSRDLLAFTNARLGFVAGRAGRPEGLDSITVGVTGDADLADIMKRAKESGVATDGRRIDMLGVKWNFTLLTGGGTAKGKL
jgi:hypothetical protein